MYTVGESLIRNNYWIQSYKGKVIDPFNLNPDSIDIESIAAALSNESRFGGHTSYLGLPVFYPVSSHSLLVCSLCPPKYKAEGLLHDASEAIVKDLPRPIKHHPSFSFYRELEDKILQIIFQKYNLIYPLPTAVKEADDLALRIEAHQFMKPVLYDWAGEKSKDWTTISVLTPLESYFAFLTKFKELFDADNKPIR